MPRGVTGFFHYNARWIVAEQGSIAGLGKSNYINRVDEFAKAPSRDPLGHDGARSSPGAGLATSDYINRTEGAADDELGASILITRGLPVDTGAGLARLLDARERKKDRSYRCYGGRLPRVGTHLILSFRYGLSAEAATEAAWEHARMLSDRLGVPLEGRVHNKDGAPDHLHLIVGTRVVDGGKLGRKCRALDAVSEKYDGKRLVEGVLGPTIETLRADWAERMRQVSGDLQIDHRSYDRRGIPVYPVTNVPRADIEYERRRGQETWRERRRAELEEREAVTSGLKLARAAEAGPAPARVVEGASITPPPDEARDAASQRVDVDANVVELRETQQVLPPGGDGRGERAGILGDPGLDTGPVLPPEGVDGDPADRSSTAASPDRTATPVAAVRPGDRLSTFAATHAKLRRQHRLTADREFALAALAGVDVSRLREIARDAVADDASAGQGQPSSTDLPPDLLPHWYMWAQQDRTARAERRGKKVIGSEAAGPERPMAPSAPVSPAAHAVPRSEGGAPPSPATPVQPDRPRSPLRPPQSAQTGAGGDPGPAIGPAAAPALDVKAGPGAFARSDVLARALCDAHRDDILSRAYAANREPPSGRDLLERIALRLRASGHDRDEVIHCLRASPPVAGWSDGDEIDRAAEAAFSERATAWLAIKPTFCARGVHISERAEVAAYRLLRKQALVQLKRELDEVWTTRNARVDDVMARHRREMAWIRDLRWRNARLRRRGLVLAILSVVVDLSVLRPLLALEKLDTRQRRQDLDAAAQEATARLRALRDEWRAAYGLQRASTARQNAQASDASGPLVAPAPSPVQTTTALQHAPGGPTGVVGDTATAAAVGLAGSTRTDGPHPRGRPLASEGKAVSPSDAATAPTTNRSVEEQTSMPTESPPPRLPTSPDLGSDGEEPQGRQQRLDLPARPRSPRAEATAGATKSVAGRPAPDEGSRAVVPTDRAPAAERRRGGDGIATGNNRARPVGAGRRSRGPPMDGSATRLSSPGERLPAPPDAAATSSPTPTTRFAASTSAPRAAIAPSSSRPDGPLPIDRQGVGTEPSAPGSEAPSSAPGAQAAPSKTMPKLDVGHTAAPPPTGAASDVVADRMRDVVIDYAVVILANGAWSKGKVAPLAALIAATTDELCDLAYRRCWEEHGDTPVRALDRSVKQALDRETWRSAKALPDGRLLRIMQAATKARPAKGRDDDDWWS